MATTPSNNQSNPQDNLTELQKAANLVAETLAKAKGQVLGITDSVRDLSQEFKKSSAGLRSIYEYSTDVKNDIYDVVSLAAKLGTEYINHEQIQKRVLENQQQQKLLQTELSENLKSKYADEATREAEMQKMLEGQSAVYDNIISRLESKVKAERKSVTEEEKAIVLLVEQLRQREKIALSLDQVNEKLEEGNKKVAETQIRAQALSKIFGTFSGIPFLKEFMNFKKISDSFKEGFGAGMRSIGSEILLIVKSPLFLLAAGLLAIVSIFKSIIKATFEFDKLLTKVGNNLGISRDASVELMDTFRLVSNGANNVVSSLDKSFLSIKNQAVAMGEIQDLLETNAMVTNEMVQSQIFLTKQMGLTGEESKGLQEMFLLSGQSVEKMLLDTRRQVDLSNKQNGIALSYKKIISDIAKVSASISVAYKNNPELIRQAVIQANKLGLSLEQTEKISKGLLDFETSISGELESELLLGRQLNFEKARALALDGKSAEAAAELMSQVGGLNALTNMNVIQRDRLAASINLSSEELLTSAKRQEVLNKLGEKNKEGLEERYEMLRRSGDLAGLAKLQEEAARIEGGKALLQDIAKANLQTRFEESMERVKQVFTEIAAGPLTRMLESIATFLQNTTALKVTLIAISTIAGVIAASLVTAAVAATIASGGSNLVAAGAIVGTGLLAGGLTAMALSGGGETPSGQPPAPAVSTTTRTAAGATDNAASSQKLEEKLDRLATAIEKDRNIYFDTTKVNTALGMGSRE